MTVEQPQTKTATGSGGGIPEIQPTDQVPATKRKLTDVGARILTGGLARERKDRRPRNRPPHSDRTP